MSAKSKSGSGSGTIRRGEIAIPEEVFNLLHRAAGAKLPDREHAHIARAVANRLNASVRRQYAAAHRLREAHGWTPEDARTPYLGIIDRNFYVIPKARRFEKGETLAKIAVPLNLVVPDADTQDDPVEEWVEIKNTGPGKMSWNTPPWTVLALATGEAEWLEGCLDVATKPGGHGEQVRPPLISPVGHNVTHLAYAYDVLAWAKSPDGQPKPRLGPPAGPYDANGTLREVTPTGTLADELAADRDLWDTLRAEPAAATTTTQSTGTPTPAMRGGEG